MTKEPRHCPCGGTLAEVDRFEQSQTVACRVCARAMLLIDAPPIRASIPLCDFHLKRGSVPHGRPLDDLTMATGLFRDLAFDCWPSPAAILDFGIESSAHLGALQHGVHEGVTAYDLDRVLGDGPAITELVRSIPLQPYPFVVFRTSWDGFFLRVHEQAG